MCRDLKGFGQLSAPVPSAESLQMKSAAELVLDPHRFGLLLSHVGSCQVKFI